MVFFELVGHRVFKSLDPALQTSPLACMAAHWLAASDYPRDLAFAAAIGLMVADETASRRVADRLGMGKAEARVLMDTAAARPKRETLMDPEVRPSVKRKLLGSTCRLAIEAWEAWNGYPSGLSDYIESLDRDAEAGVERPRPAGPGGAPGPLMGKILRRLSDARLDGEVRTRAGEEALLATALNRTEGGSREDWRDV